MVVAPSFCLIKKNRELVERGQAPVREVWEADFNSTRSTFLERRQTSVSKPPRVQNSGLMAYFRKPSSRISEPTSFS